VIPKRVAGMKLVIFGLSVSSSWGNGHATLWRGLIRRAGEAYVDVGTLHGYREALRVLSARRLENAGATA